MIIALLLLCLTLAASAEPDTPKKQQTVGEFLGQYTVTLDGPQPEATPGAAQTTATREVAPEQPPAEPPSLEEAATSVLNQSPEPLAVASEPAGAPGDWKKSTRVGQSTFFDKMAQVTWALAFISLLIWALSKVVSKTTLEKYGLPGANSQIEVLEKRRLTPGRSIMLVRVGPKVLALGATESGFQTLTEMSEQEFNHHKDDNKVVQLTPEEAAASTEAPTSPADIAKHYLSILPGIGAKK